MNFLKGFKQTGVISPTTFVSLTLLLIAGMLPAQATETPIGVCEARSNSVRVYQLNGQLKLRAFDRNRNVVWMDAPATRSTNPEVVNYRNTRGETIVIAGFNRNDPASCSITVGSRVESGRVVGAGTSGSGDDRPARVAAERACLDQAKSQGYRVYRQQAAEKAASFYFVNLRGTSANGNRYSFLCRYNPVGSRANLENIQSVVETPPTPSPGIQPR